MDAEDREDLGFKYEAKKDGSLAIHHNGKYATKFSKHKSAQVLSQLDVLDFAAQQQLMARLTGNYKHGNEREAKQHPRNR